MPQTEFGTTREHTGFELRSWSGLTHGSLRYIRTLLPMSLVMAFILVSVSQAGAATDPCQSILDQIASLRSQEQAEKDDYRRGPRDKPLASKIAEIDRDYGQRIHAKQEEYDQCRIAHGGKLDETVNFTGPATMTTSNTNAPGPFVQNVTIGVKFLKYDHAKLEITNFPTISVGPFSTPVGPNKTTVTLASVQSNSVTPSNGKITITMTLHFTHSVAGAGASDLPITISTDNTGGSRVNTGTRHLTLAGTGTFVGGFLGGSTCTLIIDGTLSALP